MSWGAFGDALMTGSQLFERDRATKQAFDREQAQREFEMLIAQVRAQQADDLEDVRHGHEMTEIGERATRTEQQRLGDWQREQFEKATADTTRRASDDAFAETLPTDTAKTLFRLKQRGVSLSPEDLETPEQRAARKPPLSEPLETVDEGGRPKLVPRSQAAGQRPYVKPDRPERADRERLVQIQGPNGQPIWVPESQAIGKPAAQAARAVTGQERQTLSYYNRAKQATDDIEAIEPEIAKMGLAGQTRMEWAPNVLQSQTGQSYRQAQRAFTEARLRKESGAAIPAGEYQNDARTYFAQPGDSPKTLQQKKAARQVVLDGLKFSAGKAHDEFYGTADAAQSQAPVRSKAAPTAGTRRRINGTLAEWDGKGWLPVEP